MPKQRCEACSRTLSRTPEACLCLHQSARQTPEGSPCASWPPEWRAATHGTLHPLAPGSARSASQGLPAEPANPPVHSGQSPHRPASAPWHGSGHQQLHQPSAFAVSKLKVHPRSNPGVNQLPTWRYQPHQQQWEEGAPTAVATHHALQEEVHPKEPTKTSAWLPTNDWGSKPWSKMAPDNCDAGADDCDCDCDCDCDGDDDDGCACDCDCDVDGDGDGYGDVECG